MFEVFSRSYYLGRLYVTPTDEDRAFMHSDQHERINEHVYATGDGLERLDSPLVMKLESRHFPVHGDESVPANTLAVPESMLEETDVRNPPSLREVFLARRERAQQLLSFAGGWQPPGVESADDPSSGDDVPNAGT
ncbi:DUF5802 family protein [Natronobacterium haloterrestre]|nr:DUF5802 family protein [Halobiforma haloterrestris]